MLEAIVLAGGLGTRLRECVPDRPKVMALIADKPFLSLLLTSLSEKGFEHVILSVGFMADSIIDYFGGAFLNLRLTYVKEETPLGTGGGLRLAMEKITTDHVYILNGDTFLDLDVEGLERLWDASHNPVIVGCQVEDASRYGCLVLDKNHVIGFSEKENTGAGIINAGTYVFTPKQLEKFALHQKFSLETDYLASAVQEEKFNFFLNSGKFIDIGIPKDFERAQTLLSTDFSKEI
jgi:D-glycero-alpha-D-manno-heptose 1-phosphate guanylyltransferase